MLGPAYAWAAGDAGGSASMTPDADDAEHPASTPRLVDELLGLRDEQPRTPPTAIFAPVVGSPVTWQIVEVRRHLRALLAAAFLIVVVVGVSGDATFDFLLGLVRSGDAQRVTQIREQRRRLDQLPPERHRAPEWVPPPYGAPTANA